MAIFSSLARKSEDIRVFEDGKESRDFVYIDDVVSAYNVITKNIESFADYEEFEIGSDNPMPVKEIVNKIYTKVLNYKKWLRILELLDNDIFKNTTCDSRNTRYNKKTCLLK